VPKQKRVPAGIERRMPILSDVAEEASVSLTPASRALDPDNDHPVSDLTRARVLAAAPRLDYRPNPMAPPCGRDASRRSRSWCTT
jgi:DNA-binding LacI/PurR family transcriptional regulator